MWKTEFCTVAMMKDYNCLIYYVKNKYSRIRIWNIYLYILYIVHIIWQLT